MRFRHLECAVVVVLSLGLHLHATIFSNVRGIVHDPSHRPIQGAEVMIQAVTADWSRTTVTNADGEFQFDAVPVGDYTVLASAANFGAAQQPLTVASGSAPILHFQLSLSALKQSVQVSETPGTVMTESAASETIVSRTEIAETPGASRTNSLPMITDFVPGAYMVHDQLHIRGGHQVSWLIDGVPVPNTNIASNVGPQFDPKDIDYIEIKSGGYSSEYGDRTYGVFNVVPRTGFERNNQGEWVLGYGSFNESNDQLSFGSHTERFAYYGSINANRTDLGLLSPTSEVIHDLGSGLGGFGSLVFNANPRDQLRLVTSVRKDHYQVPNTPQDQIAGVRDLNRESDALVNFSWVHAFTPGILLTVSPFYHFNRAHYIGGPNDPVFTPDNNRASNYLGAQASLGVVAGKHNARVGVFSFGQHDSTFFGLTANDGSGLVLRQSEKLWGNLNALFLEDQYRPNPWITLNGGVRVTRFSGTLTETYADPRVGGSLRLPKLHWVLRAYYARYYQAPPLDTVSGPLLEYALQEGFNFLPLRGERDEQHDFGVTIPFRNWYLDVDNFRTGARNFFDHDALGNSNIFLPLTIQEARIRGWEATLRSPQIFNRLQIRMAYAHQYIQGKGAVTGGLTDFSPPECCYFFLDHDQRDTLSTVITPKLPWKMWATGVISYGSGFLEGDGPGHLPAHTTADLSLGRSFGENWSLSATVLNLANRRYMLDSSNTFGGTHYANPRQFFVEVRYRFHW
jgi:outer membrane receptor protein involved in Fe transport